MSCTTLLVGKGASYDGSVMIARNDDSGAGGFTPKKLVVVNPEDQPKIYESVISHVRIELPDQPLRYTAVPNAIEGEGFWAAAGINEANVAMTATETIMVNERVLGADPILLRGDSGSSAASPADADGFETTADTAPARAVSEGYSPKDGCPVNIPEGATAARTAEGAQATPELQTTDRESSLKGVRIPSRPTPGGIGEEDLVVLVLPYIRSAREGVLRTGSLLEQYGTYEMNGIAFADKDEIWYMETLGGHHWMARRVPDDGCAILPNQLSIDFLDLDDAFGEQRQTLCSADLLTFLEENHLDLSMPHRGPQGPGGRPPFREWGPEGGRPGPCGGPGPQGGPHPHGGPHPGPQEGFDPHRDPHGPERPCGGPGPQGGPHPHGGPHPGPQEGFDPHGEPSGEPHGGPQDPGTEPSFRERGPEGPEESLKERDSIAACRAEEAMSSFRDAPEGSAEERRPPKPHRILNARLAFGTHEDADHVYNTPRAWYMGRCLAPHAFRWDGPGADFTPTSDDIPWCVIPEHRITVEDVKYILSSHYQDTPFDPYGTYGDGSRRGAYRTIGINRTDFLAILQVRQDQPADGSALEWLSFACNVFNTSVPFYANVTSMPAYLSNTTEQVSTENFYWSARLIAALADACVQKNMNHIEQYQITVQSLGHAIIGRYDRQQAAEDREEIRASLRQQANEEIAAMLKEETERTLGEVLKETSDNMTSQYLRSDH